MATDYWPQEEGCIIEGLVVGMCEALGAIGLGYGVQMGAAAAGILKVSAWAAWGDSVGIALREATAAGQYIPVAFSGIVKCVVGSTVVMGDPIANGATTGLIVPIPYTTNTTVLRIFGGTAFILGSALQAGIPTDEILVLLGHTK